MIYRPTTYTETDNKTDIYDYTLSLPWEIYTYVYRIQGKYMYKKLKITTKGNN
jgi:hypothetical protein